MARNHEKSRVFIEGSVKFQKIMEHQGRRNLRPVAEAEMLNRQNNPKPSMGLAGIIYEAPTS